MLTMAVATLAALECVAGRLAAMDRNVHRLSYLGGYFMAFAVCIVAASMIWQHLDVRWLDWAAWGIAAHLVLSWADWRNGPPLAALRDTGPRHAVPAHIESRDNR